VTGAATAITSRAATLNGTVNPGGAATTYRFSYGRTSSYGKATTVASLPAGTAAAPVSARITGLLPGRTYHYRLTATNSGGASNGADRTFRTARAVYAGAFAPLQADQIGLSGITHVTVSCPAGTYLTCTGTLTLQFPASTSRAGRAAATGIGTARFRARTGRRVRPLIRLTARGRALLRGRSSLRVTALVVSRDGAGTSRTRRNPITLVIVRRSGPRFTG
jgi:hypothetical protein